MGSTAVPAAPGAAQAAAPTQDYSAQWAAYYRSMGKIGEAEAIEAQARLKQVTKATFFFFFCAFSLWHKLFDVKTTVIGLFSDIELVCNSEMSRQTILTGR